MSNSYISSPPYRNVPRLLPHEGGCAPPLRGSPLGPGAPRPPGPGGYRRPAGLRPRARGTAGRVPPHKGAPVPPGLRPDPSGIARLPGGPLLPGGCSAGLFAHSASGTRPAAAAPCVAASAPARRARSRASCALPPAPALGLPRPRSCGLWSALAGPGPLAAPSAPLRPPCSVGLALLRVGCGAAVALRGAALGPFGLRPRSLRPGPPCGPAGRFSPFGGPGLGLLRAAACRRLLRLSGAAVVAVGFSPAPLPSPPPPLGAPGKREARWVASPPAAWVGFLPPLLRAPLRAAPAPVRRFCPGLTVLKLSTGPRPALRAALFRSLTAAAPGGTMVSKGVAKP